MLSAATDSDNQVGSVRHEQMPKSKRPASWLITCMPFGYIYISNTSTRSIPRNQSALQLQLAPQTAIRTTTTHIMPVPTLTFPNLVKAMEGKNTLHGWDVLVSYDEDMVNTLLAARSQQTGLMEPIVLPPFSYIGEQTFGPYTTCFFG